MVTENKSIVAGAQSPTASATTEQSTAEQLVRDATEGGRPPEATYPALILLWAADGWEHVGKVALLDCPDLLFLLGRAPDEHYDSAIERPLFFFPQRPHSSPAKSQARDSPPQATCRLGGPSVSRRQLELKLQARGLLLKNVGQCALSLNGLSVPINHSVPLHEGDTLMLRKQLLLLVSRRPRSLPPLRCYPLSRIPSFGLADCEQMVGESTALWALREHLAKLASLGPNNHVLVIGDSGSGKELVAQAIHKLSARSKSPIVSYNVSGVTESLAESIIFGSVKGYPNPGTPSRPGLVGESSGTTLLLDEVGDMPEKIQP